MKARRLLPIPALVLALTCGCSPAASLPTATVVVPPVPPGPEAPPPPPSAPPPSAPPALPAPVPTAPAPLPRVSCPSKGTSPLGAADVAACVEQHYEDVWSFQATFRQTYTIKVQNVSTSSNGQVTFEKPDKMRWEYSSPSGNIVVSVGDSLELYEAGNRTLYVMSPSRSQVPPTLAFLTDRGIARDFMLDLLDPASMRAPGMGVLECTPKQSTPAYRKLLLYVDARSYDVPRALLLDAQGNRNRIELGVPTLNQPVPAGAFNLAVPPGTKVVKVP